MKKWRWVIAILGALAIVIGQPTLATAAGQQHSRSHGSSDDAKAIAQAQVLALFRKQRLNGVGRLGSGFYIAEYVGGGCVVIQVERFGITASTSGFLSGTIPTSCDVSLIHKGIRVTKSFS